MKRSHHDLDKRIRTRARELAEEEARAGMVDRVRVRLPDVWARETASRASLRRPRARFWGMSGALILGASGLALAVLGIGREGGEATGASPPRAPSTYAHASSAQPLIAAGDGPVRRYESGAPVPFGVELRPLSSEGATLALSGRASVRLDANAAIVLDTPTGAFDADEGLTLMSGRIAVDVRPGDRPVRLRIAHASSELWTEAASFGALAAAGARWSVAVRTGEVRARSAAGERRLATGSTAGGIGDRALDVRPIAPAVPLDAELERTSGGIVLRGLTDLLAHLEVDGGERNLDENGRFEISVVSKARTVRVVATDAAGNRAERSLDVRTAAASRKVRASGTVTRTQRRMRIQSLEW